MKNTIMAESYKKYSPSDTMQMNGSKPVEDKVSAGIGEDQPERETWNNKVGLSA